MNIDPVRRREPALPEDGPRAAPRDRERELEALHARSAPQANLRAFVANATRTSLPPGWTCDAPGEDPRYSFDSCQPLQPGPRGAVYIRGPKDVHEVDPNDIQQGQLGDCYALASLGAVARTEEGRTILRRAIVETTRNGETIYRVTLRRPLTASEHAKPHDPKRPWKEFVVEVPDAFLPSRARGVVTGGKEEKWVPIMERALSLVRGGTDQLGHGGYPESVLRYLTGESALPSRAPHLWRAVASGGAVVIHTARNEAELAPYGLVPCHAYFVDKVFAAPDGRRFVQLANPWGHHHPRPIPIDVVDRLDLTLTASPPPKP